MSMIFNRKGLDNTGRASFKTKLFTIVAVVSMTGAVAALPLATMADTAMDALLAQIAALQAQIAALSSQTTTTAAGACTFTRALSVGVKGDDVTCLQTYLTSTGHFTYSGAKGYFGGITKSAVAAWQAANGVAPATGYFGSISRAKYSALVAVGPTPTPTSPFGTPTPSGSPIVPAGSGLTVGASSDQPAEGGLAPATAARVPALGVNFTASNDGDVTVNSMVVQRVGQADDAVVDSIVLLDENKVQIGLSKTLNSLHQVTLNQSFTVAKGTTKKMWIAFNRPAAGAHGGEIVKFQLVSVNAGSTTVNGTLPITGSGMTINETLSLGSLASPLKGTLDPGSRRGSLQVGALKFYAAGVRWDVGSAEPVSLEQVRFYQAGSAGTGDLANVMITVKGVDYPTTVSADGKYYTALITPGVLFDKGAVIDVAIHADVIGGSNRTIEYDLQKRTDIVVKGTTFGYYILPANGTTANVTGSAGEGLITSGEPYYHAYQHTISVGTLRVEKSNTVAAANVPTGASGITLGAFGFDTKGEDVSVSSLKLTYAISSGLYSYITGVSVVDDTGATIAGPKDAVSGLTTTFTDTFTAKAGYHVYTIKGKLSTSFSDGATISISVQPDTDITAKGQTTGLSITPTPASSISANTMTIRKASLKVSISDSPAATNVVRGINGYLFSKLQYDATASGEDLRITSQDMSIVLSGSADPDNLNSCQLFDGATALNTGGNVVSPSGNPVSTTLKVTFTMDNNLIVPKGTAKLVDVKCNIDGNATAAETWSLGLTSTGNDTVVVGKDTGLTVTEVTTNGNGSTMTVRAGGALTVTLDASSPSEHYGIAGKTDIVSSVFKLHSDYEALKLSKFGFHLSSSTASTSDVVKVSFWDGATKVGESVFNASNYYATSTLSADFIIPKDGDKLLSATVDLISKDSIGKIRGEGGDSGHLVVIDQSGGYTTATEAIGQSSGSTINPATTTDAIATAKGIRVVKTYPTLNRLAVPTNTLTNGDMDLYRFSVTAPTDGDVGLYQFTFRISSTTVATTSSLRIFAYTDPGFSTAAYNGVNPINSNSICVGDSTRHATTTNCGVVSSYGAGRTASSSYATFEFDPITNSTAVNSTTMNSQNSEAIQVPATQTRYFKLVGNISRATVADAFTVALVGDGAFFPTLTNGLCAKDVGRSDTNEAAIVGCPTGSIARDTLAQADRVATSSFFVWSPNTTTTAATTTNDWLNGFSLPGLPGTEMSQQSFSK